MADRPGVGVPPADNSASGGGCGDGSGDGCGDGCGDGGEAVEGGRSCEALMTDES